jgi:hypothetical protein
VSCHLTLTFEPCRRGEGTLFAADCYSEGTRTDWFDHALVEQWILLRPNHFYGTVIAILPNSDNHELEEPSHYRIKGGDFATGLMRPHGSTSCNGVSSFPEKIAALPAKAWEGKLETNLVVIKVIPRTRNVPQ